MKKKIEIVIIVLVSFLIIYGYYRKFYAKFDVNNIIKHEGYLSSKPEYKRGGVRHSDSWWFKMNERTFELENINPTGLSKRDIYSLRKGDKLIIYSYLYEDINGRIRIVGIENKNWKHYNILRVKKHIKGMDDQIFWSINFLVSFGFIVIFVEKKKEAKNSSKTKTL